MLLLKIIIPIVDGQKDIEEFWIPKHGPSERGYKHLFSLLFSFLHGGLTLKV